MVFIFLASLSIYNAPKTIYTLLDYSNLLSLILLIIIVPVVFTERKKINQIFYIFIFAILIHSFFVIFESLSNGGRAFGLLGVFYVDLAGLAILYSTIFFCIVKVLKDTFGFSSIIILIGLILTQTRNAWLSTIITLFFLLIFLFIKGKKFKINPKVILIVTIIFIIITGSIIIIASKDLNVNVGKGWKQKHRKLM